MATLFFDIETKPIVFGQDDATLSPGTAEVAALSVYDLERDVGTVYVATSKNSNLSHENWKLKPASEKEILQEFWQGIESYDVFVGYATRRFDVPFIFHRSLSHGLDTSRRLMTTRPLRQQSLPFHVDLADEFSFNGAMSKQLSLTQLTKLHNIDNPFLSYDALRVHLEAEDVPQLFNHGRSKLLATVHLYKLWQHHLAPPHFMNTIEL